MQILVAARLQRSGPELGLGELRLHAEGPHAGSPPSGVGAPPVRFPVARLSTESPSPKAVLVLQTAGLDQAWSPWVRNRPRAPPHRQVPAPEPAARVRADFGKKAPSTSAARTGHSGGLLSNSRPNSSGKSFPPHHRSESGFQPARCAFAGQNALRKRSARSPRPNVSELGNKQKFIDFIGCEAPNLRASVWAWVLDSAVEESPLACLPPQQSYLPLISALGIWIASNPRARSLTVCASPAVHRN